jgi:GNAT superfamily N-acetyltransferase
MPPASPVTAAISVSRLVDLPEYGGSVSGDLVSSAAELAIERIFFEAAGVRKFDSETERAEFRERWLGRYLTYDRALTHVAYPAQQSEAIVSPDMLGYVVGSHDDPARTLRFADIPYFADLAAVTARYPAHLHINLTESARNRGVGGRLIEAFVGDVEAAGLPGVHVVTGARSRNVGFYTRLGFLERATATFNDNPVVLLGRDV